MVWIQLLNDKNTAHTRMLYYAIKHTFTVRDKHVHDYVYSNMYKYRLCNHTYFGITHTHSRVMTDPAQWFGETRRREHGTLTCIAGQSHGVTVCRCPRVPQYGGIPRLWRKRMKDQIDTLSRNRSSGGHERVEQIPTKTSNILKHRC